MVSENITFGPVHLEITNREQSVRFWKELIGMQLRVDAETVELGTENETLVVLHPVAKSRFRSGHSGLYHLAVHVPNEPEFARVLARLIEYSWSISPTDHTMSKAIYLEDPDGITVEITLETPERFRAYNTSGGRFAVIDAEGRTRGGSEMLDVEEVLATLPDGNLKKSLPSDTKIGHVHLYVGNLETAYDFYKKLGFAENMFSSDVRFADLGAGGLFKHRIAINTWQGENAPQAPQGTAGMKHFTVKYASNDQRKAVVKQIGEVEETNDGVFVKDPAGNRILLK